MLNDEFINSEMLAEKYVDDIDMATKLLMQDDVDQCRILLEKLQKKMRATLKAGEEYNLALGSNMEYSLVTSEQLAEGLINRIFFNVDIPSRMDEFVRVN